MVVIFDFETPTKNKGSAFTASNKSSVSYSVKVGESDTSFSYFTNIDYLTNLREAFKQAHLLVGHNIKFDLHWARKHGIVVPNGCRIWDTQIVEFVLSGQSHRYPSLDECLAKYGLGQKDDKIAEYWALGVDTQDIPVDELRVYGNLDVDLTYKLYLKQQEVMTEKQKKLCLVMGLDLLVLAEMEFNGVKFDIELCKQKEDETTKELKVITEELLAYTPTPDINLDSGHQLSCFLYGGCFEITSVDSTESLVYKSGKRKGETYQKNHYRTDTIVCSPLFTPIKGSETKLVSKVDAHEYPIYQSGEDVLKRLRAPTKQHKRIIELLLKRAELAKLLDTYYGKVPELLETMEWGEYLHGQYNQVVASTGRLSSTKPNMQNFSGDVDQLLITRYD